MTIEGNKDEAERCLDIAQESMADGRFDKAERFIQKAERLYPTKRAKELLIRLQTMTANNPGSSKAESETAQPEARKRRAPPPPQTNAGREYSVEQVEAVRRVNKCKDFYELLMVTKEATDSDIKKSYKKLALQLHPDKNHAPGAAEAFKAIGNAAAVLTDVEKRKQYDVRGEQPQYQPTQYSSRTYYARGFESDVTAEELFNMFFGGAGANRVYTRRQYTREPEQRETHNGLIQLLPVLVLVLLSLMSGFFINDPIYSLQPSSKYPVLRETLSLKVPYYVKENFYTDYQGSLRRLEVSVEEEYLLNLRHACQRERNYKETQQWKARNFGNAQQYQDAQKMKLPSCDKLHSYQRG